jgi:putative Mn2+ efflux pump MntP
MEVLSILLVALALSMDCFVVAVGGSISMQRVSRNQVLRASFSFGLFQFLMPLLGWIVGQAVADLTGYDHWVAFGLLLVVGTKMIWETLPAKGARRQSTDITRGIPLLTLSVATSIDALAVGLGFAFVDSRILTASLVIGATAFTVTAAGFHLGRRVGTLLGRWAGVAGGLLLIGIGTRILITHSL